MPAGFWIILRSDSPAFFLDDLSFLLFLVWPLGSSIQTLCVIMKLQNFQMVALAYFCPVGLPYLAFLSEVFLSTGTVCTIGGVKVCVCTSDNA